MFSVETACCALIRIIGVLSYTDNLVREDWPQYQESMHRHASYIATGEPSQNVGYFPLSVARHVQYLRTEWFSRGRGVESKTCTCA